VEALRDEERHVDSEAIRADIVAEISTGTDAAPTDSLIVGRALARRGPWDPPGRFTVNVVVHPSHRRRGIGARLLRRVAQFAQARGATRLRCDVGDHHPEGVRFAERHAFHAERHVFESTLDLTSFDSSHFASDVAAAEDAGFLFASLAELGDTDEHRRRLYALHVETGRDVPGSSGTWEPYDVYARGFFARDTYRSDGQWIVLDTRAGNRWAGIVQLAWNPAARTAHQEMTGTVRDYRGRRLTLPLKVKALARAREWGATSVTTQNDSLNAPMLAVNRRLGFQRRSGYYKMYRDLTDADQSASVRSSIRTSPASGSPSIM
jgi:GNAT superfamily N-acetyltransferase